MRYRPKNFRDENQEVLNQLAKYNPYIARVYDYPELLLPHPTTENFQELCAKKNKDSLGDNYPGKVHIEIGCGSGRYLIEWALKNPQDFFIGLELRYKRLVLAAKKIQKHKIQNILLLRDRGEFLDEYLPHKSINCLHINFPDPWSKKQNVNIVFLVQNSLQKCVHIFALAENYDLRLITWNILNP